MGFCNSLDIVGSALTAERFRTDIITQNIANEKTPEYRRQQVVLRERGMTFSDELSNAQGGGVRIEEVIENDREFAKAYDPTNPLADENGYVTYSNVDSTEEMVDLMAASNAYSANLTALSVVKSMITKTLDLKK